MAGRHTARNIPFASRQLCTAFEEVSIVGQTVDRTTLAIEDQSVSPIHAHIEVYHNSVSPANSDTTGGMHFMSLNSVLTSFRFANMDVTCTETAPGIHSGAWRAIIAAAGVSSNTEVVVGAGFYDQSLTDGGINSTNFTNYLVNGQQMLLSKFYVSPNQAITGGALTTVAHGLGAAPAIVEVRLVCGSAEDGWVILDETNISAAESILGVYADATNVYVRCNTGIAALATMFNKTTGALSTFTPANWSFIIRAWL